MPFAVTAAARWSFSGGEASQYEFNETPTASLHRGRTDFRAGHGDQFGRRGSRPEQAKRDQYGEADPSYAMHFHPPSWQDRAGIFFAVRM